MALSIYLERRFLFVSTTLTCQPCRKIIEKKSSKATLFFDRFFPILNCTNFFRVYLHTTDCRDCSILYYTTFGLLATDNKGSRKKNKVVPNTYVTMCNSVFQRKNIICFLFIDRIELIKF